MTSHGTSRTLMSEPNGFWLPNRVVRIVCPMMHAARPLRADQRRGHVRALLQLRVEQEAVVVVDAAADRMR